MTRLERLRHELVALAESLPNVPAACGVCNGHGWVQGRFSERRTCVACEGNKTRESSVPHPLAAPLRGIAWSLLPREERYREPEHAGGPLTSGGVDVEKAADELQALAERMRTMPELRCLACAGAGDLPAASDQRRPECAACFGCGDRPPGTRLRLAKIAEGLRTAVVQARPGETLDDVLRREGLSLSEPCEHCDGVGVEDNHETCCQCAGSGEVPIESACVICEGEGLTALAIGYRAGEFVRCSKCTNGRVVTEDAIEVRVAGQVRYARRREA